MPKVTIDRSRDNIPTTSGQPRAGFMPNPDPNAGQGLAALGGVLGGIGETITAKNRAIRDSEYIISQSSMAAEKIAKTEQNLRNTLEDPTGYTDALVEQVDAIHNEIISGAPSDEVKLKLRGMFADNRTSILNRSLGYETKSTRDKAISSMEESLNTLTNRVVAAPDQLSSIQNEFEAIIKESGNILEAGQEKELSTKARKALSSAYLKGLINQDPAKAISALETGNFDSVLNSSEQEKFASAALSAQERMLREQIAKEEQQQKVFLTDLQHKVYKGEASQLDIDQAFESGFISYAQAKSLTSDLSKFVAKENDDIKSIVEVDTQLSSGVPLDTTDPKVKKSLDTYFDKVIEPKILDGTIDLVTGVTAFIDDFKYIPKKTVSSLTANLHNGNEEQAITSAQVINNLIERHPSVTSQFDSVRTLARARKISSAVNAGVPNDMAIKAANDMIVQKGSPEYETRQKELKEYRKSSSFDHGKLTSFFADDPNTVPAGLKSDFETLQETFVVNYKMDLDDATDLAYKTVQKNWGVTTVNGEPEYMRFAPESIYNKQGLDPKWIRNQLRKEVSELKPDIDIESVRLVTDPSTIKSDRPGYNVMYTSPSGVPLILSDDTSGRALVWRPDFNTSEDVALQKEEVLEKAKEYRESRSPQKLLQNPIQNIKKLQERVKVMKERNLRKRELE